MESEGAFFFFLSFFFFFLLKWWGKAFPERHLKRNLKAVRVQASRYLKQEFQAKGTAGAKAPRQRGCLACLRNHSKEKNVASIEGVRETGWEDVRSERLRG